jgi:uncharacterized membrane protein
MAPRASVPALSVIVPAFNEEARLESCVASLTRFLASRGGVWELVVVDDGSRDATPALLDRLARHVRGLVAVHLPRNRGKGAALRAGLRRARGRLCVFTDCDLSTPPSQIPAAVRHLQAGHDLVIGSRVLPGARLPVPQPLLRRIAGRVFNWAVQILLGLPYADTQCGFKGMTNGTAKLLAAEGRVDGFEFDVEWLLIAKEAKLRVLEFPITWSDRAHTTVKLMSHSPAMFAALFRLQRRFHGVIAYHPVRAMPWILTSVVGAVAVQMVLKTGARELGHLALTPATLIAIAGNRYLWASILLGAFSAATWLMSLARVDLSFAFPMISLGYVFVTILSFLRFGEALSWNRLLGVCLVVAGVLMIASSGKPAEEKRA